MEKKIRKDNRKALPKYLLIMAASLILGGVAGYLSVSLVDGGGVEQVIPRLRQAVQPLIPFVLPAMILALILYYGIVMKKVRKVHAAWDGEDEETSDWLDRTLSDLISVIDFSMPLSYMVFSLGFCWGDPASAAYLVNAGVLLVYLAVESYLQMRAVNFVRTINPEKQGSVFDLKFAKKWRDSCDEAEKKATGEACYTVFKVMNMAYAVSFLVLIFTHILFSTGLMPIAVVMVLWMISAATFGIKVHRLNSAHIKD